LHPQRLPLSVAKLVDQSPLSTPDGSLLLGSQHTSVFLLDGRTGQLLRQGLLKHGPCARLRSCRCLAARASCPAAARAPLSLRPLATAAGCWRMGSAPWQSKFGDDRKG
jgi:hypothetical protein